MSHRLCSERTAPPVGLRRRRPPSKSGEGDGQLGDEIQHGAVKSDGAVHLDDKEQGGLFMWGVGGLVSWGQRSSLGEEVGEASLVVSLPVGSGGTDAVTSL